jgi:ABC-type branched-subunit amino acid transport system substrate-binding protein
MTAPFTKQYGSVLTDDMFLPGMAYYGGSAAVDARTRAAMDLMIASYRAAGAVPDQVAISGWDPTMFVLDTLKRAGLDASATKLRDVMIGSKGFVGANGAYDFPAYAQRGIGQGAIVMVRWDVARGDFVPVSQLGGLPLRGK